METFFTIVVCGVCALFFYDMLTSITVTYDVAYVFIRDDGAIIVGNSTIEVSMYAYQDPSYTEFRETLAKGEGTTRDHVYIISVSKVAGSKKRSLHLPWREIK